MSKLFEELEIGLKEAIAYEKGTGNIQSLGEVDAERFISLMNREPFDYTKWRQNNLQDENVRELSRKAMKYVESIALK